MENNRTVCTKFHYIFFGMEMTANSENKSPEMGNIFRLFYFYFYLRFLVCAKFLRLYLCAQPSYTCVCVCVAVWKVLCF